jgi:hypothetical protein
MQKSLYDAIDPEIAERLVTSSDEIAQGRSTSSYVAAGLAMGSIPIALAALSRDAFAAQPTSVTDILKFAFILENLEFQFYDQGLNSNAFAGARAQIGTMSNSGVIVQTLQTIRTHELNHVNFLKAALGSAAPTLTAANFDLTGGNGSGNGPFASATTNAAVLLAAAQAFEDTGVRAYKGQAPYLYAADTAAGKPTLTAALQIHSVEARHASQIRRLRGIKGWITGAQSQIAAPNASFPSGPTAQQAVDAIYVREDNVTQGGVNLTTSIATNYGGTDAATEAFDEPLTYDEVVAIVKDFIVDNAGLGLP